MDGSPYSGWSVVDGQTIKVSAGAGEHTFELRPGKTSASMDAGERAGMAFQIVDRSEKTMATLSLP